MLQVFRVNDSLLLKNLHSYIISTWQLTGLSSDQKNGQESNTENQEIKGRENAQVDGTDPDQKHSKDMVNLFDHLIQNLEYQVDQDLKQEGVNSKKKKKRDQRQIR